MRQVHESDGSEMTRRQEGTAGGGCRDCPEMFNTRIYKNPRFPPSGALFCTVSSIFSQPSHPMAFTHVHRVMEIPPFTVIPYKPKMQKPSNRSDHNRPSKPLALQPSSLKPSQGTDSGKSLAETSPESSWLAKNAGDYRLAAGNAVGHVNDPKSAEGMRLDRLFPSKRHNLTIYIYRHGQARKRVGSEK